MKKLTLFSSITLLALLFCSQASFSQSTDTIENRIRNQFILAVDAAASNSNYSQYVTSEFVAQKQHDYTKYESTEALGIYRESIAYYVDNKSQVVENLFNFDNPQYVIQTIKLITIETDTSRGFAVDGITPGPTMPKHMDMILHWRTEGAETWKISYFYRSAVRDRH